MSERKPLLDEIEQLRTELATTQKAVCFHQNGHRAKEAEIERLQKEIKFLKQLAYTHVDPTGETPEVQEYMVKLIEEDL